MRQNSKVNFFHFNSLRHEMHNSWGSEWHCFPILSSCFLIYFGFHPNFRLFHIKLFLLLSFTFRSFYIFVTFKVILHIIILFFKLKLYTFSGITTFFLHIYRKSWNFTEKSANVKEKCQIYVQNTKKIPSCLCGLLKYVSLFRWVYMHYFSP